MRKIGTSQGVLFGDVFVADLRPALVLYAGLPQEIAGEPCHMAAGLDKSVDGVAHARAPVFVMSDKDRAAVVIEHIRHADKVMLCDDIECVPLAVRPSREVTFVAGPAGGRIFLGIAIGICPFHIGVAHHLSRARSQVADSPRRAFGQFAEPPCPWTLG